MVRVAASAKTSRYVVSKMTDEQLQALETLRLIREAATVAIYAIEDNVELTADRDYWKQQYNELLNSTIKHSEAMTGGMLMLAMRSVR